MAKAMPFFLFRCVRPSAREIMRPPAKSSGMRCATGDKSVDCNKTVSLASATLAGDPRYKSAELDPDDVFDELEHKYQTIAKAPDTTR